MFTVIFCIGLVANAAELRDSVVNKIVRGQFEEASDLATRNYLVFKNDDLILGFVDFAYRNRMILHMPLAIYFMTEYREKEIIREWERFAKLHPDNIFVLEILGHTYMFHKPNKIKSIADKIDKKYPDEYMPHLMKGHLFVHKCDYPQAGREYRSAFCRDSSIMMNRVCLAYAYMRLNEYDSALHYLSAISCTDTIYNRYLVWAIVAYLKKYEYAQAESMLTSLLPFFRWTSVLDTLKSYFHKYTAQVIAEHDSFIIPVGWMIVLITADSVELHEGPKVYKKPEIEVIKYMTKEEYRAEICGKGIRRYPYFGLFITKKGILDDIFVFMSSGNPEVDNACMEFLRQQKYKAGTIFGHAVDMGTVQPFAIHYR